MCRLRLVVATLPSPAFYARAAGLLVARTCGNSSHALFSPPAAAVQAGTAVSMSHNCVLMLARPLHASRRTTTHQSPNSLLSSDQSQAQSRRWESLGGASTESTFELQADIMDSVHELMGPAASAAPAAGGATPTLPSSPSSFSRTGGAQPKKRRESVGSGRAAATAAAGGAGQRRRQSVADPPPSPTVELSGALESYMGALAHDIAANGGGGEAAVSDGVDGATAVQAQARGGDGWRQRRRQSSVGGAPASPTIELEADLMGYIDDPVAEPVVDRAEVGSGVVGGRVRAQSMGSPSATPAVPSGAVATGDAGDRAEEGGGAEQAGHSSPSRSRSPSPSPSRAAAAHQPTASGAGAAAEGAAVVAAAAAARPPLHRLRRASVSAAGASREGGATQGGAGDRRRASLQIIMRASRRKSLAAAPPSAVGGGGGGWSTQPDKARRRESAAGILRRRLTSADSGGSGGGGGAPGQDAAAVAPAGPAEEGGGEADQLLAPSEGDRNVAAGGQASSGGGGVDEGYGEMDESMEDMTAEDLTENVSPLVMDVNVSLEGLRGRQKTSAVGDPSDRCRVRVCAFFLLILYSDRTTLGSMYVAVGWLGVFSVLQNWFVCNP